MVDCSSQLQLAVNFFKKKLKIRKISRLLDLVICKIQSSINKIWKEKEIVEFPRSQPRAFDKSSRLLNQKLNIPTYFKNS